VVGYSPVLCVALTCLRNCTYWALDMELPRPCSSGVLLISATRSGFRVISHLQVDTPRVCLSRAAECMCVEAEKAYLN